MPVAVEVVGVLEVEVLGVEVLVVGVVVVDVEVVPVLVVPPPVAADWPVLPLPSPAPPVPPTPEPTPPFAFAFAPPWPTPPVPVGTNGRKTTGRELGDVCATAGSRYGRSTGTAGIGVNDLTVTAGGEALRVVEGAVAVEPGASVDGAGVVRVTVVVVCEGIRPPSA